jgi:hypothetical protein
MKTNLKPGYVSILAVVSLSAVMLLMLTASFRFSIQNQEIQKKSQMRIDYTSREQALLRSLLTGAPIGAMLNMMENSDSRKWEAKTRWLSIFEYARKLADGEYSLDDSIAAGLGLNGNAHSGNTGDGSQGHIAYSIGAVKPQPATDWFYLNAGLNGTTALLGDGLPESLALSDFKVEKLDRDRPIITFEKTYSNGDPYKLIPYPNIHFGYITQGKNFLAKRNWWAFSITYGSKSKDATGVETKTKNYVLSIYEVPSQLALGSTATTFLGKHEDGSAWGNINIDGGVFARKVTTEGSVTLDWLSSREGISMTENSSIGGVRPDKFSGKLPSREKHEADTGNFFPLSNSSDSGLVAFLPITRGAAAFDDLEYTTDNNRASPTSWNYYSRPALQTVMKLRIEDVISLTNPTPTSISFTYMKGGIATKEIFDRGNNWPTENSAEGATFPFQLETTQIGRQAITVYVDRLTSFLAAAGADSLAINNSLMVNANYRDNVSINKPNIPSLSSDISLVLRGTKDLTPFPTGFSLVTPFRMYLANDVNIVSNGVDSGENEIFPPLSLFAPEKRFGVREEAMNIEFKGQINHIGNNSSSNVRLMDLRSGINDEVISDNIQANLHSISDLSQLPPINQMNWLVVIEEFWPPPTKLGRVK